MPIKRSPPNEVIVSIPEGYELDFTYGNERIIRAKKGMVSQRAEGIIASKGEYILVVDDDIEFGPDFVDSLYRYCAANCLDCVLPFEGLPPKNTSSINLKYPIKKRIRCAITGQMFQSGRHSTYLDAVTATAGHKVYFRNNNTDMCYPCQTGNFQCFFIKRDQAISVHLEDEIWLQQGSFTAYAAYDDMTFFYKLFLLGGRIAYSLKTRYKHLDAGAGRKADSIIEAKQIRHYSIARNRTIFWHRFLFQPSSSLWRKMIVIIGGMYGFIGYTLWTVLINIRPKHVKTLSALFKGYYSAFKIITNRQIPSANLSYRK